MCFQSKGSPQQIVAGKKLYLEVFIQKPPEPFWYYSLGWERKKGVHRASFCSTNKTVSYRHWHACQRAQIRRSQMIGFSTRPSHPMHRPRVAQSVELWTLDRGIFSHVWVSRLRADHQRLMMGPEPWNSELRKNSWLPLYSLFIQLNGKKGRKGSAWFK